MLYDDEESKRVNTSLRLVNLEFQSFRLASGLGDVFHGMGLDTIEKRPWSSSAPEWRHATQGTCTNTSCKAYGGSRVIVQWGRRDFSFFRNEHECACPICKEYVQPIICGFYNTKWRVTGIRKWGRGKPAENVSYPWQDAGADGYTTFDDDVKNFAEWTDLKIEVKPR